MEGSVEGGDDVDKRKMVLTMPWNEADNIEDSDTSF